MLHYNGARLMKVLVGSFALEAESSCSDLSLCEPICSLPLKMTIDQEMHDALQAFIGHLSTVDLPILLVLPKRLKTMQSPVMSFHFPESDSKSMAASCFAGLHQSFINS